MLRNIPFLSFRHQFKRANINFINDKFKGMRIGIIGLGGTGSYLDLVAKTPVDEILLFDDDEFLLHNAFRDLWCSKY